LTPPIIPQTLPQKVRLDPEGLPSRNQTWQRKITRFGDFPAAWHVWWHRKVIYYIYNNILYNH
jgi:hypothetical protein